MGQNFKNIKDTVIIGRDANGSDVKIDRSDFSKAINSQIHRSMYSHWFLWGIVIIILGIILVTQTPTLDYNQNYIAVILGFIGVLATFIVVSNYAQLKNTENTIEKIKTEIDEKISIVNNRLDKMDEKFNLQTPFIEIEIEGVLDKNTKAKFVSDICDNFPNDKVLKIGDSVYVFFRANHKVGNLNSIVDSIRANNPDIHFDYAIILD